MTLTFGNPEETKTNKPGLLLLTFLLYILMAISFAFILPETITYFFCATATLSAVLLMWRNFTSSLYLIVLVTHIGPIVHSRVGGFGVITLGDFYLGLLLVFFIIRQIKKKTFSYPYRMIVVGMALLSGITLLLSADILATLPGIINLAQMAFIYLVVYNEVRTRDQAYSLLRGVGVGVLVSALLHLFFYSRGLSLALSGMDDGQASVLQEGAPGQEFIRTAFFYVSFHASSASAIVLGVCYLMRIKNKKLEQVFWICIIVASISSSLISSSKTTLVSAGTVCILAALVSTSRLYVRESFRLITILCLLIIIPVFVFKLLVVEDQQVLLKQSFLSDSVTSMDERFQMWGELPKKVLDAPKEFIIGLGPGLPERSPENEDVRLLMYISALGFQPPSFHNFYADVLFQHGLIFFVLMLTVIISTMRNLWKSVKSGDILAFNVFFALLVWLLVWMSHATGWNKPVGILSILFSLGHLITFHRFLPNKELISTSKSDFG